MALRKLLAHDEHKICLLFDPKRGKVTLGGEQKLQDKIYKMYLSKFGECDGEPDFYTVIRNKVRITFNCSMKNFTSALLKIKKAGYDVYDVDTFDRGM